MKNFLIALISLFCLLPTAKAEFDASQLISGLLSALDESQEQAPAPGPQKQKTEDFGDSMLLMTRAVSAPLVEAFKEEGREYAQEVGDIITQRIMKDKKISGTLDSMRIFCWAVVAYLTVVTILIIVLLLRLRVLHNKLMKAIQKSTIVP